MNHHLKVIELGPVKLETVKTNRKMVKSLIHYYLSPKLDSQFSRIGNNVMLYRTIAKLIF